MKQTDLICHFIKITKGPETSFQSSQNVLDNLHYYLTKCYFDATSILKKQSKV